jgi:hypothetical protein
VAIEFWFRSKPSTAEFCCSFDCEKVFTMATKKANSTKATKASTKATKPVDARKPVTASEILALIVKAGKTGITRTELRAATGKQKGWSALLGAPTSEYEFSPTTFEGKGLVTSHRREGTLGLVYVATAKGIAASKGKA